MGFGDKCDFNQSVGERIVVGCFGILSFRGGLGRRRDESWSYPRAEGREGIEHGRFLGYRDWLGYCGGGGGGNERLCGA
jgi:hypothetical protein